MFDPYLSILPYHGDGGKDRHLDATSTNVLVGQSLQQGKIRISKNLAPPFSPLLQSISVCWALSFFTPPPPPHGWFVSLSLSLCPCLCEVSRSPRRFQPLIYDSLRILNPGMVSASWTHLYPTNKALLMNFRLSSDAEILLLSTDSIQIGTKRAKRVCNVYISQPSFHFAYHDWWSGRRD